MAARVRGNPVGVSLEERIDELYALPPEAFTAARDALVKELRAAGDKDGATRVKGLRKPTVAAWALNQLARREGEGVRRLREAGQELARAQRRALAGLDPRALRAAQERRRAVAGELLMQALGVLQEAGVAPDPHADAVRGGLDAAAVDAETGEALAAGRLSRPPPAPSGFGGLTALTAVPSEETEAEARVETEQPAPEDAQAQARRARDRLAQARKELDDAGAAARARREQADDAATASQQAAEEVSRLERELAQARKRQRTAAERATSTAERAQQAEELLARRQDAVARAEAEADGAGGR